MKKIKACFLIDDDVDDQDIFIMAVQRVDENIQCVVANDGIEGLNKLSGDTSFIPDYIFLDVNMPKMNGIQCLPEIKKLPHLSQVKIIMFSTTSDPAVVQISKELGATDFLVKPPSLSALVDDLVKIMGR